MTVEQLARALYETDGGSNGYPPSSWSTKWEDADQLWSLYRTRATHILALVHRSSSGAAA